MKVENTEPLRIETGDNLVSVLGENLDTTKPWHIMYASPSTIVLTGQEVGRSYKGSEDGFFVLNQENFKMYFTSLAATGFTGAISVEIESETKTIYLLSGKVVFASSSLIDDRLGEICYRHNIISLQDLLNSTVKVDDKIKFGQVLLKDQVMNNMGISLALKKQVGEIIKSLFLSDYLIVHAKKNVAPVTEVIFLGDDDDFIDDCYVYGLVYMQFTRSLMPETQIQMTNKEHLVKIFPESTFYGDMLALIEQYSKVDELVQHLNLSRAYALNAIFHLYINGYLRMAPLSEATFEKGDINESLNEKIHTYELFVKYVKDHFEATNVEFPVHELIEFVHQLNGNRVPLLKIDKKAYFTKESIARLQKLTKALPHKQDYFNVRLDSMMRFVMQIAQDNLSEDLVKLVKGYYYDAVL